MSKANLDAIERIKASKAKSLKLMQMDANGTLDKIANGKRDAINEGASTSSLMGVSENRNAKPIAQGGRMTKSAMNIPKEILESFQNNQIDIENANVLDSVFGESPAPTQRAQITEQAPTLQYQQQPQVSTQGIDYPMIRTIVEDIVRKYTSSLQKKILSESKQSLNEVDSLVIGNTFKFLSKNGDLYECTLKKIKNIKD